MTWDLVTLGEAIAAALEPTGVKAFASPPTTLNPPAYVVNFPDNVDFGTVSLSLDTVEVSVSAIIGLSAPPSDLADLIAKARDAFNDRRLGGAVANCNNTGARGIRTAQVAGIDVLTAELTLTIQQ